MFGVQRHLTGATSVLVMHLHQGSTVCSLAFMKKGAETQQEYRRYSLSCNMAMCMPLSVAHSGL